ncbi:MAG: hypothetical protein GX107_03550 [Clostridiales bacterium]|nr:hypothetical protein [Clostridiales bacterium]
MKNRIIKLASFLMAIVVSASVLYSCKGGADDISTTGDIADEVIATAASDVTEPAKSTVPQSEIDMIVKAALGDSTEWNGDYSTLSKKQKTDIVNAAYDRGYIASFNGNSISIVTKSDYEASQGSSSLSSLTDKVSTTGRTGGAPIEIITNKTVATTVKGVTTTARRGIVPGTTAKSGITTTAKGVTTTSNKSSSTAAGSGSSTGASTTNTPGGVGEAGEGQINKPDVTYLEKYVINVINSKKYTMKMVMNEDDSNIKLTHYVDNGKTSTVCVISYGGLQFTSKFISMNGKSYILIPLFAKYAEVSKDDVGDYMDDSFGDMMDISAMFGEMGSWEYQGITRVTGMNIESYKDASGTVWRFFFNSSGLQRIDSVSNGVSETFNIVIESGVSSKDAFVIPAGYTKTSFEDLFSSVADINF